MASFAITFTIAKTGLFQALNSFGISYSYILCEIIKFRTTEHIDWLVSQIGYVKLIHLNLALSTQNEAILKLLLTYDINELTYCFQP
jgi:hypothetical protein